MHHISYPIITRKNRERKKDTRNVRETSINNLTMTSDFFSDTIFLKLSVRKQWASTINICYYFATQDQQGCCLLRRILVRKSLRYTAFNCSYFKRLIMSFMQKQQLKGTWKKILKRFWVPYIYRSIH